MNKEWSGVIALVLRLIVGIVGLLVLMGILAALPPLQDLKRTQPIIPRVLNITILTALIAVIFWFGWRMKSDLPPLMPRFPGAGNMVFALSGLAISIVAYFAYNPDNITSYYLANQGLPWLYPLIFLLLALGALGALVALAFINIDKLTQLAQGGSALASNPLARQELTQTRAIKLRCPSCNWPYQVGDQFCSNCAAQLPGMEKQQRQESTQPATKSETVSEQNHCPQCGRVASLGDTFCGYCGQKLTS